MFFLQHLQVFISAKRAVDDFNSYTAALENAILKNRNQQQRLLLSLLIVV